ncbi:MAG: hypothetical protein WAW30_01695 [Patescibacteria group bacterium]
MEHLSDASLSQSASSLDRVTAFTQLSQAYERFTSSLLGMPKDVSDAIVAAGDDMEKVREIWNQYTDKLMMH